jgi:nitronate monooxygenase
MKLAPVAWHVSVQHDRGVASLRTPLCGELGIEYPIFSVGFGVSAGPELAAAVSKAGGCGVLGAGEGVMPGAELRRRIGEVRRLTDRPFGVNFVLAPLEDPLASEEERLRVRERIADAVEERVPAIVLFWGDPAPFVEEAGRAGVRVVIQVGSVAEAKAAAAAGVAAVIAQGIEAGGQLRGTASIWDLLPAVVEAVRPLPVLASGGIGDGAGIARALRLGAQGVSLGTRFVASEEAWIHPAYKERVVRGKADDTFLGELFTARGRANRQRALRNKAFEAWDRAGRPAPGRRPDDGTVIGTLRLPWGQQAWQRYDVGMLIPDFDGDPDWAPMWAGESIDVVNDVEPAGTIVRRLVHEAEAALSESSGPSE